MRVIVSYETFGTIQHAYYMFRTNSVILLTSFIAGIAAASASAQTLTALIGLGSTTNGSLIQGTDGYLYGVIYDGIYKLALDGTVTIPALMSGQRNKCGAVSDQPDDPRRAGHGRRSTAIDRWWYSDSRRRCDFAAINVMLSIRRV